MTETKPTHLKSGELAGLETEQLKRVRVVKEELAAIRQKKLELEKDILNMSGDKLVEGYERLLVKVELESQKVQQLIFLCNSSESIGKRVGEAKAGEEEKEVEDTIRREEEREKEKREGLVRIWKAMSDEDKLNFFLHMGK